VLILHDVFFVHIRHSPLLCGPIAAFSLRGAMVGLDYCPVRACTLAAIAMVKGEVPRCLPVFLRNGSSGGAGVSPATLALRHDTERGENKGLYERIGELLVFPPRLARAAYHHSHLMHYEYDGGAGTMQAITNKLVEGDDCRIPTGRHQGQTLMVTTDPARAELWRQHCINLAA
jgi:hypothetical protein